MAHFYGDVCGKSRTKASRLGGRNTGLVTTAASWQGAVKVTLSNRDGVDCALVELTPWRGAGVSVVLYDGPVAGQPAMRKGVAA